MPLNQKRNTPNKLCFRYIENTPLKCLCAHYTLSGTHTPLCMNHICQIFISGYNNLNIPAWTTSGQKSHFFVFEFCFPWFFPGICGVGKINGIEACIHIFLLSIFLHFFSNIKVTFGACSKSAKVWQCSEGKIYLVQNINSCIKYVLYLSAGKQMAMFAKYFMCVCYMYMYIHVTHTYTHMGHFPQDGEHEQNLSEFFFFEASLWPNGLIFLSFLNCSEEIMSGAV